MPGMSVISIFLFTPSTSYFRRRWRMFEISSSFILCKLLYQANEFHVLNLSFSLEFSSGLPPKYWSGSSAFNFNEPNVI